MQALHGCARLLNKVQSWAKLERSRRHVSRLRASIRKETLTYGEKLLAEYKNYYKAYPLRRPGDGSDDLTRAAEARARKSDWNELQQRLQANREGGEWRE